MDERETVTVKDAYERRLWQVPGGVLSKDTWEQHIQQSNAQKMSEYILKGKVPEMQINPFPDYDVVAIRPIKRGREKGYYAITFQAGPGMCAGYGQTTVTDNYAPDTVLRFTDAMPAVAAFLDEWRHEQSGGAVAA